MNSHFMPALALNGILHGTLATPPALIGATGHEYAPPGVATILRVVAAESARPTFRTFTIQKSDEVWVVFSMTRSGMGDGGFGVFPSAMTGNRLAQSAMRVSNEGI